MKRRKPRPEEASAPAEDAAALRRTALGLLARREHSRLELRHKLVARDLDGPLLDDVLDALEAEDLLSDRRFVESYVHARVERGYGPLRIRAELRERGVDGGEVDAQLDDRDPAWRERVAAARRKRFGGEPPEDYQERARQARFLQQRGFTPDQIRRVFRDPD